MRYLLSILYKGGNYMKRLFIALIISFVFLSGCSTKVSNPKPSQASTTKQAFDKQVSKPQKTQTVQSTQPNTSDNSTTKPTKNASTPKANNNTSKNQSKSQSTPAVKNTTTPKPSSEQPQIQSTPQILGNTDTNADFNYFKTFGFNVTAPDFVTDTCCKASINNCTISWDGSGAPNFLLKLVDWTNNPNDEVIFWAYIGNVHSYTFSPSILKVGHHYEVDLEATNGTNYGKPGYETLLPKNLFDYEFYVDVTN